MYVFLNLLLSNKMKRILILFSLLQSVFSFSQNGNSWLKKADFAGLKREGAIAFSIGDFGYIGTGVDTAEIVLKDLWKYDPTTDSYTQMSDLPAVGRTNAFAFTLNNKGYVGGGVDNNEAQLGQKLNDFWEYSPTTNSWISKGIVPIASGLGCYYSTTFVADNQGYVCGGKVGASQYTSELWVYKPLTNTWLQRMSFPGGLRYNMTSFSVNNRVFTGLGTDQNNYRKDWYEYIPATNSWVQKDDFIGGQRGGASGFATFGNGYICLGTNGGLKGDLYQFNPISENWSIKSPFGGSERKQAISFTIGNRVFVGTGSGVSGKRASMYEYFPAETNEISENEIQLKLFPNPVAEILFIQSEVNLENTKITIISLEGKIVTSMSYSKNGIDVSTISNGNYLLKIELETKIIFLSNLQIIH